MIHIYARLYYYYYIYLGYICRFRDFIGEEGVTFEISQDYLDENNDEEFSYSPYVQYSNEEMLNMLNMNGFEDDDDRDDENATVSLCGMSFEKLKVRMTSLTTDQKVNQILYYLQIVFFIKYIIKVIYIIFWIY